MEDTIIRYIPVALASAVVLYIVLPLIFSDHTDKGKDDDE